jgi:hypothetical protein
LVAGAPNQYELTVRGQVGSWTEEVWEEVYGFAKGGAGMAGSRDKYVAGKFRVAPHSKEGHAVEDCADERHRHLLAFLIPILYPEKPTRITSAVANTIFGALDDRTVCWGKVVYGLVRKLAETASRGKPSPISPYLFHLYHAKEVLTAEELLTYKAGLDIAKYNLTEEIHADGRQLDSEAEGVPDEPLDDKREKRRKRTDPASRGAQPSPDQAGPSQPAPAEPMEFEHSYATQSFWEAGRKWVSNAKDMHTQMAGYLAEIGKELGAPSADIIEAIRKRPTPETLREKEEQIRNLTKERDGAAARANWLDGELHQAKRNEKDALKVVRDLSALVATPGEVVNRSTLFENELIRHGHITGSKIIIILTDFQDRMERVLREMRELVTRVNPDQAMDFSRFPEVPANLLLSETPIRQAPGIPTSPSVGLGTLLRHTVASSRPASTPSGSGLPIRSASVSPLLFQQSMQGRSGSLGRGGSRVAGSLAGRLGPIHNPAKLYPTDFEHMQVTPEKKPRMEIDLTSPVREPSPVTPAQPEFQTPEQQRTPEQPQLVPENP